MLPIVDKIGFVRGFVHAKPFGNSGSDTEKYHANWHPEYIETSDNEGPFRRHELRHSDN